jgi:Putative auto-transporter adhesin, head GIN domain
MIFSLVHSNNSTYSTDKNTKIIQVDAYDEINIVGSMDVELVAGKEGQITVNAPNNILPSIKAESQNNTLQIYSDQWKNFGMNFQFGSNNSVAVTVPFETLNRIKLTGSGKVKSKDSIVTKKLTTNLAGSGDIFLNVMTDNLESDSTGSGSIYFQGKTNDFRVQVFGSGIIEASELESQNAKVSLSGSGDIRLWAIQSLEANTFGSGSVLYKGNPIVNNIKVSGSGEIKKID